MAGTLGVLSAGLLWVLVLDTPAPSAAPRQAAEKSSADITGELTPRRPQPVQTRARPIELRPVALEIPAIDVETRLVGLGLEPDRTVEVPADADQAGWYRRGPAPGRAGSSVILGHVDSVAGPAVFARLGELRPDDSVIVRRADGSVAEFVVLKSALYPNAEFPADRVYAAQGMRRLNLVTCGGTYDADRGGYQSNLVVYTRLTG